MADRDYDGPPSSTFGYPFPPSHGGQAQSPIPTSPSAPTPAGTQQYNQHHQHHQHGHNRPRTQQTSWSANVEMSERAPPPQPSGREKLHAQVQRRHMNDRAVIENPLAHLTDEDLVEDVEYFSRTSLPAVNSSSLLRAARVAKDIRTYDEVARGERDGSELPVQLTDEEKAALKAERDVLFSEKGMRIVILTVSLAAFLQGHVQSSINSASTYPQHLGLNMTFGGDPATEGGARSLDDWRLGAANASPFLAAGLVGCLLALPVNHLVGRRGAMVCAAVLIFASSLAAAFARRWDYLLAIRIVNGLGMGIKAVSTPILASETAVGFWRGSSILAWQLWVAFGIMMGFVFNLIFLAASPNDEELSLALILGSPFVPSLMMLVGLWYCPESPRFYMRPRGPKYNPAKAFAILCRLRNTELQALRDVYLVYKSIEQEEYSGPFKETGPVRAVRRGFVGRMVEYFTLYRQLFSERRLRNALISSSTVNLSQQLCGINILAFYSGNLFLHGGASSRFEAFSYSLGFGAINFVFGLPAIRTIDTLGRRKWLTITIPLMAVFMAAAAASFDIQDENAKVGIVAMWLFLFAAAYSPGMGPIPFTLASESFPLSHREAGCAFAIMVNLTFAGILSIVFPSIISNLGDQGCLSLFSGLNVLAFVLVFLLVEETKRRSLEDLDLVFAVPKRVFMRYQVGTYIPWFFRRYFLLRRDAVLPSLYIDKVWGRGSSTSSRTDVEGDGGDGDDGLPRHTSSAGGGGGQHRRRGDPPPTSAGAASTEPLRNPRYDYLDPEDGRGLGGRRSAASAGRRRSFETVSDQSLSDAGSLHA